MILFKTKLLLKNYSKATPITLLFLPSLVRCMCGNSYSIMAGSATVKPTAKHTASVIFLHGLGDTGHSWAAGLDSFKEPHIKYICPTAPTIPVTLNSGFQMPAWFDIVSLSFTGSEDSAGIINSSKLIQSIIEEEVKAGIDRSRIIIGGFSQGGAVALYSALSNPQPVGGVVCLSCWLPLHASFPEASKGDNSFPILQCHGDRDPMVNYKFGQMTASVVSKMCTNHTFTTYPGLEHSSSAKEMLDVKNFILKVLPPI
ncbi:acyl-protein thioesterase 2-like [Antedon mediterranea]|uniref:acyl-protein thioesterase 2-like n=1 Tax=Antedon mediterranea TaxID=105859 RepID=UPI003AF6513D